MKRKNLSKILILFSLFVFITSGFYFAKAAERKDNKIPIVQFARQPLPTYINQYSIKLEVTSPNYRDKVEYRVFLYNIKTKKQIEAWKDPKNGNFCTWYPVGTSKFQLSFDKDVPPGTYKAVALVRRHGSKVPYDSVANSNVFVVKPRTNAVIPLKAVAAVENFPVKPEKDPNLPVPAPIPFPFPSWKGAPPRYTVKEQIIYRIATENDPDVEEFIGDNSYSQDFIITLYAKGWVKKANYTAIEYFQAKAGKKFVLRAPGCEDVPMYTGPGSFSIEKYELIGHTLNILAKDLPKLKKDVKYTLVPVDNNSSYKWTVLKGVSITFK